MFKFSKVSRAYTERICKYDDEIQAVPFENWIKVGVNKKYCSYCGENLIKYSIPSNNPFRKFDVETGKLMAKLWLLCPNRESIFSSLYWDTFEPDRHDGYMVEAVNEKTANDKIIHCVYCGAIMNGVECSGCGARVGEAI